MAEFLRVFRVQGMDSHASPRFQMVPRGGTRYVALRGGRGANVISLNPTVCTVREVNQSVLPADDRESGASPDDRYFRLDGAARGPALIQALGGSVALPLFLEVSVKERRRQIVSFTFISDNAHHSTQRPSAIVGSWMPTLNFIWRRQANVELVNHGVRHRTIGQDLGNQIMLPAGNLGTTGTTIAAAGESGIDLNVFFVWEIQETGNPGDVDAVGTIGTANGGYGPGTIIFEDRAGQGQAISLAHEIGHHLGLRHGTHVQRDLMWPWTGQRGINLTKDDVNTANP